MLIGTRVGWRLECHSRRFSWRKQNLTFYEDGENSHDNEHTAEQQMSLLRLSLGLSNLLYIRLVGLTGLSPLLQALTPRCTGALFADQAPIAIAETLGPEDMSSGRRVTGIPSRFLRSCCISSTNTLTGVTNVMAPRSSAHRAG